MTGLRGLLRLQLRMQTGALRPASIARDFREKKFSRLFTGLLYVLLAVWLLGIAAFVESKLMGALLQLDMPLMLPVLAVLMTMLSTLLMGFFSIFAALYFSKDAPFLAALPVSSRAVLTAKLAGVWVFEMIFATALFAPACVIYGHAVGEGAGFYLTALLVLLLLPVLPMMIVTALSMPLIRVSALWRRRELASVLGGVLLILLMVYAQLSLTSRMPEHLTEDFLLGLVSQNSAMIAMMTAAFPPAKWAGEALGGSPGALALFVLSTAAACALVIGALGGLYQKLSLLQCETPRGAKKARKGLRFSGERSPLRALCWREWSELVRTPTYVLNCLMPIIMPIIMLGAMYFALTQSEGVALGELMEEIGRANGMIVAAVVAGLCIFCVTINAAGATAFTREGRRFGLSRMLPVPARTQVLAKQLATFLIPLLTVLIPCAAGLALLPALAPYILAAFLVACAFGWASNTLCMVVDMLRPKLDWSNETQAVKQSMNFLLGMLIDIALMIATGAAGYGLYRLALPDAACAAILLAMLLLLCALSQGLLMRKADSVYAKVDA